MSVLNVSTTVFEVTTDAYDPDYHWGGISIYPEGPLPTEVQYPGLPKGMTLPPGLPIHLDFFVTPAPAHLAHIPLECPGAPRPDRKPVKPRAAEPMTLGSAKPKYHSGIYGSARRLPSTSPTFVYAYPCTEQERWAHLPEHLRPVEENPKVQMHNPVALEEESYEREPELVQLQISHPRQLSSSSQRNSDSGSHPSNQLNSDAHTHKALRNFRAQFGGLA